MAIYKEILEKNYTVVGNPTISDTEIVSDFSTSSYCTTVLPSISNSFTLISRIYLPDTLVAIGGYGTTFSTDSGNSCYGVINAAGTLYTYIHGGSELGTNVQLTSGWKWLRMELTSSSTKMYTIDDDSYTEETLPPLSEWTESCVSGSNILGHFSNKTLFIGVNNFQGRSSANWQIDLKNTKYIADGVEWRAVREERIDVSGSVKISKGYYSDGSNKIIMPSSTYNIDALTANQTTGGKNKLFVYTDSTDSVGALIASTTPTGSFKITKDLEQPVYLDHTKNYIAGGEIIEPVLTSTDTEISSTKALQYSEAQDTTYWIPSKETVSLGSVKATQSVGPVNDLYLTTTTGTPAASLSFSDNGEIVGAATKLPLKQKVYLNNDTDEILGIQERPDEIVISTNVSENYTVTGSPTITSDYVVSGLSGSNYLSRPTDTTFSPSSSAWEIKAKVTTGSLLGSADVFINADQDQRGIRIGFQNHSGPKWQFLVSRGYSWIDTSAYYGSYTVQPNTTYWIKAGYNGSEYYLEYSIDGSEYIRDVTYSSSYTVGAYALQIRSAADGLWTGSVDLKEISVTIGSETWWDPVNIQDGVSASGWSHYGPAKTIQFMPGVDFESVAVTPAESYTVADMVQSKPIQGQSPYPLYYRNTADYSGIALFGTYQSFASQYTGYRVTFTDSTRTTIASLEKLGVRCRLYCTKTGSDTSSYGQELTYYAVTIPQFESGLISGTQIKKEAITNQNLGRIPLTFTGTITVGTEVVYSSTADTITEGSTTATFVGEYIVEV